MSVPPAVLTDSRLGVGTLLLGTTDYGAQLANVVLTPTVDSTDGTPTLGIPDPLPEEKESWALEGSAIQDFELATGFVNFCFDNAGSLQPFTFTPATDAGTAYTGQCRVWSVPIGGDAGVQITADFSFAVEGKPTRTDATTLEASASTKASKGSSG